MAQQRDEYGLPPLTEDVRKELTSNLLPIEHKYAPRFDMAEPHKLKDWLLEISDIFSRLQGMSEAAKVRKALQWCTSETRDLLRDLDSVKIPDFTNFKRELQAIFIDSVGDARGSRWKLNNIVNKFFPITIVDTQKLRIYNKLYESEADKLLTDPALIANSDAVKLYRSVFDDEFRQAINMQIRQEVTSTVMQTRRREDPFMLKEVMTAAEKAQAGGALFDALYDVSTINHSRAQPGNPLTYRRGPIALPFAPEIPKQDSTYLKSFKRERSAPGEFDLWGDTYETSQTNSQMEAQLAQQKDSHELFMKEIRTMSEQFKEGMGAVNQLANVVVKAAASTSRDVGNGMPTVSQLSKAQPNRTIVNRQGAPMTLKELLCFMCKSKEHLMYDCPYYTEYLRRGWLVKESPDSKRVQLRDGVRMPYDEPGRARWQAIEQIAKEHGWDKAEAYFANMCEAPEEDYSDQLDPNYNMTVWMNKINELSAQLEKLGVHPNTEEGETSSNGKNY